MRVEGREPIGCLPLRGHTSAFGDSKTVYGAHRGRLRAGVSRWKPSCRWKPSSSGEPSKGEIMREVGSGTGWLPLIIFYRPRPFCQPERIAACTRLPRVPAV